MNVFQAAHVSSAGLPFDHSSVKELFTPGQEAAGARPSRAQVRKLTSSKQWHRGERDTLRRMVRRPW